MNREYLPRQTTFDRDPKRLAGAVMNLMRREKDRELYHSGESQPKPEVIDSQIEAVSEQMAAIPESVVYGNDRESQRAKATDIRTALPGIYRRIEEQAEESGELVAA